MILDFWIFFINISKFWSTFEVQSLHFIWTNANFKSIYFKILCYLINIFIQALHFYFSKSEGSLSKLVNFFSKLYIFLNIKISDLKIIDIEDSKNSL